MNKKDIKSYTFDELKKEIENIGEKAFRAKQIYEWLHVKLVDTFDEMSNLSKVLREKLEVQYRRDECVIRFLTFRLDKYALEYAEKRKSLKSKEKEN